MPEVDLFDVEIKIVVILWLPNWIIWTKVHAVKALYPSSSSSDQSR